MTLIRRWKRLILFKRDMGSFGHAYTFLSQIFDYGNTGLEKRAIFYKRLMPLLEFGREREGVDLSQVVLTHHILRDKGKRALPLWEGEAPKLKPLTDAGSGSVQEKEKALSRRDHREGERSVRSGYHRGRQTRLCERCDQG